MQIVIALSALAQADQAPAVKLNASGWVMMSVSIVLVCGLSAFCLHRILREPTPSAHHHAPQEIETDDHDS